MSNTLLTPTMVTREAARILHQKLNFIGRIDRQYDDSYAKSPKIGNTLKVRMPNQYSVRTGMNMAAQNTVEESVDLVMGTVKGVDLNFTSEELTLSLDDFSERIIKPAMTVLAANVEADVISTVYKQVWNLYDGDTAAFGFASVANARQILTDNLAPLDPRTLTLNTTHATKFMIDTKSLYHDSEAITKQYREGKLGKTGGFDGIYENTLLLPHTTGTAAKTTGYDMNTSTGLTSGSGTLTIATGSTTFLVGDVVTIAGVNRVHPETKADTGVAQQFVVTANSGTSATSLSVAPVPVTSGARQNVVVNSPGASKAITKVGAGANETLVQSLAFHKEAFAFVTADLPLPDGVDWAKREVVDGISLSLVRDFSISDRTFPCRIDILYGCKAMRPQLATRIHNDG